MRIIYSSNNQKQANLLAHFLASEGIDNQLEISTNTDWGSENYSDVTCKIWVYDEDQIEKAMRWVEEFQANPESSLFADTIKAVEKASTHPKPPPPDAFTVKPPLKNQKPEFSRGSPWTMALILLCSILFMMSEVSAPRITDYANTLPAIPLYSSPLKKQMLYDYPYAFEIIDKMVSLYGPERAQNISELPPEGKILFDKFNQTPYWKGYYEELVHYLKSNDTTESTKAPLFEKIRKGEFWRLFSPALLHSDILHILFNMIWLVLLGQQMESRLGWPRYLTFIVIAGVFSNTMQYLVSGGNFIGFSGVLCAMLTFIWTRQRTAPWEGYPLQQSTINFLLFFITLMLGLQVASFFMEVYQNTKFPLAIANTAHFAGAFIGIVLGRIPFFSRTTA